LEIFASLGGESTECFFSSRQGPAFVPFQRSELSREISDHEREFFCPFRPQEKRL
jgi:hypothetical protein